MYVSPITDALINILSDVWRCASGNVNLVALCCGRESLVACPCLRLYRVRVKIMSDEKCCKLYDPHEKTLSLHIGRAIFSHVNVGCDPARCLSLSTICELYSAHLREGSSASRCRFTGGWICMHDAFNSITSCAPLFLSFVRQLRAGALARRWKTRFSIH